MNKNSIDIKRIIVYILLIALVSVSLVEGDLFFKVKRAVPAAEEAANEGESEEEAGDANGDSSDVGSEDAPDGGSSDKAKPGDGSKAATDDAEDVTQRYLFVGNSLTYYNNYPEMFSSMADVGAGEQIGISTLYYPGRDLFTHSRAIEAVIRTKGKRANLTEEEKLYFCQRYTTVFDKDIYKRYADCLWDKKNKCPKKFDVINLQLHSRPNTGDALTANVVESIARVIRAMNAPDTVFLVNGMMFASTVPLKEFVDYQNEIDRNVSESVAGARAITQGLCRRIEAVPAGRSLCNYLLKYGTNYAQKIEPEAYYIYSRKETTLGNNNDLMYADGVHPTQLGSYVAAATLYSVMFGDPTKTVADYRGDTHGYIHRLDGVSIRKAANFAYQYRDGKGIKTDEILRAAADTAWKTVKKKLKVPFKQPPVNTKEMKKQMPVLHDVKKSEYGIQVTWESLDGAERYRILRKKDDGDWKKVGSTRGISLFDTKAKWGHTYTYSVVCINWEKTKETSSFDPVGLRIDYYRKPELKSVRQQEGGIRISWKASEGVERYRIMRKNAAGKWKTIGTSRDTTYVDTFVKPGLEYTYSVRALDATGSRTISNYDHDGLTILYNEAIAPVPVN